MCPERRNPAFSEERIEQAILGNLEQIEAGRKPAFTPKPKPQPYRPHPKYAGFLALYYLCDISDAFDPRYLRRETGPATENDRIRLGGIERLVTAFLPVIREHTEDTALPEAVRQSWIYLLAHAEYCRLLASALIAEIRDKDASCAEFDRFYQWVKSHELELAPVLDVFELLKTFRRRQE